MRIIVTGASGLLGSHVCRHLLAEGHVVTGIDRTLVLGAPWEQLTADLTDLGVAMQLIRECDCVMHIASIPRPLGLAEVEVFRTNMALAYNVTEAACLGAVPRVVYASSVSILGYPFGARFVPPDYLPINADHPVAPQDSYGLSKWLGEEVLDAAVRRCGISAVSLRMPWIQTPEEFGKSVVPRRKTAAAAHDLWAYLDARDAATGFSLALAWPGTGHLRVYLSAQDSFSEQPSAELIRKAFPETPLRRRFQGFESLIDTAPAVETLGFQAQHSWRDYEQELAGQTNETI